MKESIIIQISAENLAELISRNIKKELVKFSSTYRIGILNSTDKPHLTRKEAANFFDVSLSCVDNWCNQGILDPYKVGNRTYFKKSDLLKVLFDL